MSALQPALPASPAGAPPEPPVPASAPPGVRVVRHLHDAVTVRLCETAGRTRATVSGEIDLLGADTLRRVLSDSLRSAPRGLEVDLGGVDFFDCSGLNVLLHLRARAQEYGVALVVTAASPAVARVLEITGAADLLAGPPHG